MPPKPDHEVIWTQEIREEVSCSDSRHTVRFQVYHRPYLFSYPKELKKIGTGTKGPRGRKPPEASAWMSFPGQLASAGAEGGPVLYLERNDSGGTKFIISYSPGCLAI